MAYKNKELEKEYRKEYRRKNPDKVRKWSKQYRDTHKKECQEYYQEYISKSENKERREKYIQEYHDSHKKEYHEYYQQNKERIKQRNESQYSKDKRNERLSLKRKNDPRLRLKENTSRRIRSALKGIGKNKSKRTEEILGCSIDFLKSHLEKQFQEEMNWSNYGLYGWHIDHIRPCASFDLSNEEELLECFHYTNLQPLWAKDNLSKRDHWLSS